MTTTPLLSSVAQQPFFSRLKGVASSPSTLIGTGIWSLLWCFDLSSLGHHFSALSKFNFSKDFTHPLDEKTKKIFKDACVSGVGFSGSTANMVSFAHSIDLFPLKKGALAVAKGWGCGTSLILSGVEAGDALADIKKTIEWAPKETSQKKLDRIEQRLRWNALRLGSSLCWIAWALLEGAGLVFAGFACASAISLTLIGFGLVFLVAQIVYEVVYDIPGK